MHSTHFLSPFYFRAASALRVSMAAAALASAVGVAYIALRFPGINDLDVGTESVVELVLVTWVLWAAVAAFAYSWVSSCSSTIVWRSSKFEAGQFIGLMVCAYIDSGVVNALLWPQSPPELGKILVFLITALAACAITVLLAYAPQPSS